MLKQISNGYGNGNLPSFLRQILLLYTAKHSLSYYFFNFQKIHYTRVSEKLTFQRLTYVLICTNVHCSGEMPHPPHLLTAKIF